MAGGSVFEFVHHQHVLADFLEDLFDLVRVGIKRHGKAQFHDDPITAEVGDLRDFAVRDRMDRSLVVAQLHRADRDFFDRAHCSLDLDIFTCAEGVIDQEEDA